MSKIKSLKKIIDYKLLRMNVKLSSKFSSILSNRRFSNPIYPTKTIDLYDYKELKNSDMSTVYLASNDRFSIREIEGGNKVFLGIGNTTALDIISNYNFKKIFLVDINPSQIEYIRLIIKIIKKSNYINDFIEEFEKLNSDRKASSNVIGLLNVIFTRRKIGHNHFPIIRENGFLSSDKNFNRLKNNLNKETIFISKGISRDILESVLEENKYCPMILWISNILAPSFMCKEIKEFVNYIIKLKYKNPTYYDIEIFEDDRKNIFSNIKSRNKTNHWLTFSKIIPHIEGKCLEVIDNEEWLKQPSTINSKKILLGELEIFNVDDYDTVFFHNITEERVVNFLKKLANKIVIILNRNTCENKNCLNNYQERIPSSVEFILGYDGKNRNIMYVYKNKHRSLK